MEQNKNFSVLQNTNGTYTVLAANGRPFVWGKNIREYQLFKRYPDLIRVKHSNGKVSLFNKDGLPMQGARRADDVIVRDDKHYNVYRNGRSEEFKINKVFSTHFGFFVTFALVAGSLCYSGTENSELTPNTDSINDIAFTPPAKRLLPKEFSDDLTEQVKEPLTPEQAYKQLPGLVCVYDGQNSFVLLDEPDEKTDSDPFLSYVGYGKIDDVTTLLFNGDEDSNTAEYVCLTPQTVQHDLRWGDEKRLSQWRAKGLKILPVRFNRAQR